LIDAGLQRGETLLLVVRNDVDLEEKGRAVLAKLAPYLLDVTHRSAWPGTRLLDDTAAVHRFRFNFASAEIVKDAATRLYDWVQPELPEDLCILRGEGTPWLVTITHEKYSCLYLNEEEYEQFGRTVPTLVKSLRRD